MTTISTAASCTVIVTVDADRDVMPDLEQHARAGLAVFAELDGFISGALHKSRDGTRLVQYLQWRDEASHLACMNDPRWDEMASAKRFMEIVASGQARMKVDVFDVIALADAPA